jgi:hypothetical protein
MPDGDGDRSLVGDAAEGTARVGIAVSWSCCWVELARNTGHDGGEQGSVAGAVPARCVACQGSQRQPTSTMRHRLPVSAHSLVRCVRGSNCR